MTAASGRRRAGWYVVIPLALFVFPPAAQGQLGVRWILNEVTADFAVSDGHPLVKTKFNLYDPQGPSVEQFERDVGLISELNVDNYRIELAWGGSNRPDAGPARGGNIWGTRDSMNYDFSGLERIVRGLWDRDVRLLSSYSYTPTPLQNPAYRQSPRSAAPVDMEKWGEVVRTFARHFREIGLPFGVHEIWNEPDGRATFFSGRESEYQQMYAAGVRAIRADDPDATVAGPASAPGIYWIKSFPEFVAENDLPLDFLTYHAYGSAELALEYTDSASASLSRFPSLRTVGLSLDEWHFADCCQWCLDDARQTYEGASQLFADFRLMVAQPELTSVSWAWFLDPNRGGGSGASSGANRPAGGAGGGRPGDAGGGTGGERPFGLPPVAGIADGCMGLVTQRGERKAVFNAWKIYASMPVDRRHVDSRGSLQAMASTDTHTAALVVWNRDPFDRWISGIHLKNVPFSKGDIRVYRIDAENASIGDGAPENLEVVETFNDVFFEDVGWTWSGRLPRGGVLFFEARDRSGISELAPVELGKVIRINRDYPARGRTDSYADFDRKTWIARLGMMSDTAAEQKIGVLADGLPDVLDVAVQVDGALQKAGANSLLAVRVDYRVNHRFVKSILYHGPYGGLDLYEGGGSVDLPWTLTPGLNESIGVGDLSRFQIDLRRRAPVGWTGVAHITFLMQEAGANTQAKFTLRPVGQT